MAAAGVTVLLALAWTFFAPRSAGVTAVRIMPSHTAPGQPFPVVVKVESESSRPLSVILRETLPRGARAVAGTKGGTMAVDPRSGEMKWIHKMKGGRLTVGYLLRPPEERIGAAVNLSGTVNLRRFKGRARAIAGASRVEITPYHWADFNRDNHIDDQEILTVYEDYSEVDGLTIDLDFIEEIWFGNGYHWDVDEKRFVIDH